jgi:hypothetical protein
MPGGEWAHFLAHSGSGALRAIVRTGQLPRFTDRSIAPGPSARLHLLASFPNRTENVSAQTADFAFARKQSCAAVIFYVYQFDLDVDPAEACIQNSHTSALCGCK